INTLSMSLMERTREFGVMRALGTSGKSLAGQITAEAFYLGLIGAIPGILLGLFFSYLLATYGFNLGETTAYGMSFSEPIYGEVHPWSTIRSAIIFTLLTAAVSLFTAIRASRLDPVEAMRR
ncbi:MAG: ABC transporter permease, partial [Myxococcota bacterium]|nr:ABC transporter permease [Myxococcota bacterium]